MQDTASVPCWLSSDGQETYYLGIQVDISAPFHPPQLKHRVLVEGTVTEEPRICGGIVLKPVSVSVLPEVDLACNTVRPTAGYSIVDPPRGAGPSNRGKRIASDPVPPPPAAPAPADVQPFSPKTYTVPFAFDGLYMDIHAFMNVLMAARYASSGHPNHVTVTGYRCRVILSNGKTVVENCSAGGTARPQSGSGVEGTQCRLRDRRAMGSGTAGLRPAADRPAGRHHRDPGLTGRPSVPTRFTAATHRLEVYTCPSLYIVGYSAIE